MNSLKNPIQISFRDCCPGAGRALHLSLPASWLIAKLIYKSILHAMPSKNEALRSIDWILESLQTHHAEAWLKQGSFQEYLTDTQYEHLF